MQLEQRFRTLGFIFHFVNLAYILAPIAGFLSLELNPLLGASFFYSINQFPILTLGEHAGGVIAGLIYFIVVLLFQPDEGESYQKGRFTFLALSFQFLVQTFSLIFVITYALKKQADLNWGTLFLDGSFLLSFVYYCTQVPSKGLQTFQISTRSRLIAMALVIFFNATYLFAFPGSKARNTGKHYQLIMDSSSCLKLADATVYFPKGCIAWLKEKTPEGIAADALCQTQVEHKSFYESFSATIEYTDSLEPHSGCALNADGDAIVCTKFVGGERVDIRFHAARYASIEAIERAFQLLADPLWCLNELRFGEP